MNPPMADWFMRKLLIQSLIELGERELELEEPHQLWTYGFEGWVQIPDQLPDDIQIAGGWRSEPA